MERKRPKLGNISCVLSLLPLIGGGVCFLLYSNEPENRILQIASTMLLWATILISPVVGVVLGLTGVSRSENRKAAVVGSILNTGWIIFIIWMYVQIITFAHCI